MKIKVILTAASLAWCAALDASTLSAPTAVQIQPDAASYVIAVLKAGTEEPAATDKVAAAPAGWTAIDVAGPFEAYVKNKDLSKGLDVIPGASVYASPKDGSAVLTIFAKGDRAEITGLKGGWTQIRLDKTLVGYIQTTAVAAPVAVPVAPAAPLPAAPTPIGAGSSAPAPAAVQTTASVAPQGGEATSRLFEGTLSSTHSLLFPRRPYDWQLNDPDGKRIAYVDLTHLLLTDQIENYAGHQVVVLGSLKTISQDNEIVIDAEGLRIK